MSTLTQPVIFRLSIKSIFGVTVRDVPMWVDYDSETGRVLSAKHNDNHDELGRFASADSSSGSSGSGGSGGSGTAAREAKAKVVGKVSKRFQGVVNNALATIDPKVMEKLDIQITACPLVTEGLPDLATSDQEMKGWQAGSTFDNTNGVYDPNSHQVVVAETYINANGVSVKSTDKDMQGCVRHEVGHGVDDRLGSPKVFLPFSHTDEKFIAAYKADVADILKGSGSNMSGAKCHLKGEAKSLEYFILPEQSQVRGSDGKTSVQWTASKLGREEAFADAFAALYGGGCGGNAFEANFPRTMEAVQNKMAKITKNKKAADEAGSEAWRKATEATGAGAGAGKAAESKPESSSKACQFGQGAGVLMRRATGRRGLIGDAFIRRSDTDA
ncbi:MAG: hypothetical protein WCJ35_26670, partial [Planctomycetota bacterium]